MSKTTVTVRTRGQQSRYLNGGSSLLLSRAPIEPDDGVWSREELIRMDSAFVAAAEAAFRLGLESPASAKATQSFQKFLKRVDASSV
jgi:hypothetical protein